VRLSLRFLVPLLLALGAFAYISVPLADSLMQRWFVRDLDIRSSLIAGTVQEQMATLVATRSEPRITAYFNRMLQDERLYGVGLCLDPGASLIATPNFPREINCGSLQRYTNGDDGQQVLQQLRHHAVLEERLPRGLHQRAQRRGGLHLVRPVAEHLPALVVARLEESIHDL